MVWCNVLPSASDLPFFPLPPPSVKPEVMLSEAQREGQGTVRRGEEGRGPGAAVAVCGATS